MTLEDLKDQIRNQSQQLWDRIQEHPTFLSLRDRYENLSPKKQKLSIVGVIVVFLLVIFSIPFMTYRSSSEQVTEYEEKKELIRDLLHAAKEAQDASLGINLPSVSDVRSQVESLIKSMNLLPEQNMGITVQSPTGNLIKGSIIDGVVEVSTAQLNLTQIVQLATNIVRIQGTKLKDLLMKANGKDARYYDATFRIVVFKGDNGAGLGGGFGGAGGGRLGPPGGRGGGSFDNSDLPPPDLPPPSKNGSTDGSRPPKIHGGDE